MQIQRKQFKLAMSVGKGRHYALTDIMPRHFLQTADLAGVGARGVSSIVEDLAANAERQAASVFNALPSNFPGQLVASVESAIADRSKHLAVLEKGAHKA